MVLDSGAVTKRRNDEWMTKGACGSEPISTRTRRLQSPTTSSLNDDVRVFRTQIEQRLSPSNYLVHAGCTRDYARRRVEATFLEIRKGHLRPTDAHERGRVSTRNPDCVVAEDQTCVEVFAILKAASGHHVRGSSTGQNADVVRVLLRIARWRQPVWPGRVRVLALPFFVDALCAVHLRMHVDVKETALGMTIEVRLVTAVHTEVMVNVIVSTSIVIVQATAISRIVCNNKIVVDIIAFGNSARRAVVDGRNVGKAIPRVESTVISTLSACVEQ